MASPAKWDVVSHGKKKKDKKASKKAFIENATVVDTSAPLETTRTIYQALDKNKAPSPVISTTSATAPNGIHGKKPTQTGDKPTKSKKKEKKPAPVNSLEDAVKTLDCNEMKKQFNDIKTRCQAPSLSLGEFVNFLNVKLSVATKITDPFFSDKPEAYPLSALTKNQVEVLRTTFKEFEESMLEKFFIYCMTEMKNDSGKAGPNYGYRITIQFLARNYPEFVTKTTKSNLEFIKKKQGMQQQCQFVMWVCSQAGNDDVHMAFKVWSDLMLPLIGYKAFSQFSINYLADVIERMKKQKVARLNLTPSEFFPILDFVFTPNTSLPQTLQQKLEGLYPKLKEMAFGHHPQETLRHYFPSLLTRVTGHNSPKYKAELLSCLVRCLSTDRQCLSVWRQLYVSHLQQSGILLTHLLVQWEGQTKSIPRQWLHETVQAFSITNEDLASDNKVEECKKTCQELLLKMTSFEFPWKIALLILFISAGILLFVDVNSSGSFAGSRLVAFGQKSGLTAVLTQAWNKLAFYSSIASKWLLDNVPKYYAQFCNFCAPYLRLLLQYLAFSWNYFLDITQPIQQWLKQNIPIAIAWVEVKTPIFLEAVLMYLTVAYNFIAYYVGIIWAVVGPYFVAVSNFVEPYVNQAYEGVIGFVRSS
ncbi:transmembrane protein 214-A-like [Anneissia japonica]|uniref:transmembrane protein 214-A-like n=1 Tax=Anneissia japonica TaxID=1529436 RepID=UPI0014256492|nr:transmembrane protein 214-A-like [Anneissia japonica]